MDISNVPSEAPSPGPWSRRRRLTLGFTAIALVAGGGVAIAAGQPDTDSTDDAKATAAAKPVPGKAAFGVGGVLHSESVVSDGNGGYLTHLTQVGKVSSVDADNLTVLSEDGYQRSWSRTSDTVVGGAGWSVSKNDDGSYTVKKDTEDLASGDQVVVMGTLSGDEATAQRISQRPDTGEIPGMVLKRFEGEFGGKTGGQDGAPQLKDRMMRRFDGGPGGEVRRFEFRTGSGGEAGTKVMPEPAPDTTAPATEAPSTGAEPALATSSGSVSFT
ncbi:hypothetical protein [Sporichthya sp.]|uniref:hypothetical protein n=1 Tax=Sporichthya sp. TaxID=65475 RepID=UPI0017A1E393|nr:hypothetical protein [Sporichthya sp.]MBA3742391.1 hypothetical protein [Sporichthya sp.]